MNMSKIFSGALKKISKANIIPGLVFMAVGLIACGDDNEGKPPAPTYAKTCVGTFPKDDDTTLHFTYPRGGETFSIGDTVGIGICEEDTTFGAIEEYNLALQLVEQGKTDTLYFEIVEGANSFKGARKDYVIPATIPVFDASEPDQYRDASTVTSKARFIVKQYNNSPNSSTSKWFAIKK